MNLDGQANHPPGPVARGLLLRVLREHHVLRDSWIHPARANGAYSPEPFTKPSTHAAIVIMA
jgi:hypothetical protein